jgi:hypothetical protein
MTPEMEQAVRRLVNGFDSIPAEWAALVAQHIDGDECVALPMWGTLFKVSDSCDRHNIERLMSHPVPADIHGLIEFMEDRDIDPEGLYLSNAMELIALAASEPDEIDEDDIEALRLAALDAWRESMDEDAFLADSGWEDVGGTGLIAREFDGQLLLGVNGAGYSFYDSHWRRLYEALGYEWHK